MEYQGVWILGEQEEGRIKLVTLELLKRGRALADKRQVPLTVLLMGEKLDPESLAKLGPYGADQVIVAEHPALRYYLPEPYVAVCQALIAKYRPEIMLASATTTGRSLMPALAVKCHAGLTADCTDLDIEEGTGNLIQTRPAIGGNILATIKTPSHRPQMATVRPHSNKPLEPNPQHQAQIIYEKVEEHQVTSRIKRLGFKANPAENASIQDADVVVAGGKGFKKAENFQMVHTLAELLRGAVGASRDAVDLGWAPYAAQVGLSGKTVSPKLYLAIGISGSVQHLAGIKTSELICAINNDPEAQIFQVADLGIVADLFEAAPLLIEKLQNHSTQKEI